MSAKKKVKVLTASHAMGLGVKFGATPDEILPAQRNMNALEVIGEGIALLLANPKDGGFIEVFLENGDKFKLTSGRMPGSEHPCLLIQDTRE